jgi:hypothetical protein
MKVTAPHRTARFAAGKPARRRSESNTAEKIRTWQGDLPQHDDITLIVAKVG